MNTYCVGRFSRPVGLFSLGLLNVPQGVRLRRSSLVRSLPAGFGLSRLATVSLNSPGWMMTVAAIMGGLLPIMWTTGTGADVMKRIAAPMIGGMVSSTILTLLVIPALYAMWRWREVKRKRSPQD